MKIRRLALVLLAAGFCSESFAQTSDAARIDALEKQVTDLSGQVLELRGSLTPQAQGAPRPPTATVQVTMKDGRPTFASDDGNFSMSIRLLTQVDFAYYMQGASAAALPAAFGPDLSSGANFRRANIGFQGTVFHDWNYNLMLGFGGNGIEQSGRVLTAYVEYGGWAPFYLRAGAYAPPSSLDGSTPSTDALMMERSGAADVQLGLTGGDSRDAISAIYAGDRLFAGASLTGAHVGDGPVFDEQMAVLGRVAVLPLDETDAKMLVGFNGAHIFKLNDQTPNSSINGSNTPGATPRSVISLSQFPELSVDSNSVKFTNTGSLPATHVTQWGVDAGLQLQNLYANGGYFTYQVDRAPEAYKVFSAPGVSATQIFQPGNNLFSGWYGGASWVLTGESRQYSPMTATFLPPKPDKTFSTGGFGAVEWAARYSVLDFNNRINDSTSLITDWSGANRTYTFPNTVRGGKQTIIGTALNWYPNNALRFTVQYQWIDVNRLQPPATVTTTAPGTPSLPALNAGQKLQTVGVRAQVSL